MTTGPRRDRAAVSEPLPPTVKLIIGNVAKIFNVTSYDIRSGSSVRIVVEARAAVVKKLRGRGHSQVQIGRWLGLNHSSVHYLEHRLSKRTEINTEIPVPDLSGEWAI